MKRMVFAVLLAVFVCCSLTVIAGEWDGDETLEAVPELLKQQTAYDPLQWKLASWYNLNLKSDYQEPGVWEAYWDILDLHGHAMGYITVPSQGLCLPIRHGAGEKNTAGHIRTTAFPIGGAETHAALTGAFSLNPGDCFYIHILGQVRPYRVSETAIVPDEGLAFPVQENQELCTLVNTGPEGTVYLMQGSHWEDAPEEGTVQVEPRADVDGWLIAACVVFALGILLVPFLMWCRWD